MSLDLSLTCAHVGDNLVADSQRCVASGAMQLDFCTDITDAAVIALLRGCPNLADIAIKGCGIITDEARAAVCESHKGIEIRG